MGFSEWAKRLDDRVVGRAERKWDGPRMHGGLSGIGLSALIVFGGGLVIRLCFRRQFHASGWILGFYAGMATMGLILLVSDRRQRRTRGR